MLQLIASIVPILPASLLWEIGAADWDAWGLPVAASGPQSGVGWAGELRDPATGLTYLRARDYSPSTAALSNPILSNQMPRERTPAPPRRSCDDGATLGGLFAG